MKTIYLKLLNIYISSDNSDHIQHRDHKYYGILTFLWNLLFIKFYKSYVIDYH